MPLLSTSRRCRLRAPLHAALTLVLFGSGGACHAQGSPWSALVAATTDYVFRGVSQTYGEAALQGGVNYQSPLGWFAGAWGSNVQPYPFGVHAAEVNLYGGFARAIGSEWTTRATYTRYLYAWDRRPAAYDYGELSLTVAFQDRFAATVSYQPDSTRYAIPGYVRNRTATAYELNGRWPLPRNFALTAGVGYYDLTRLYGVEYWSGSAGASYLHGRFQIDLARFFAEPGVRRLFEDASSDGSWVATAVFRF